MKCSCGDLLLVLVHFIAVVLIVLAYHFHSLYLADVIENYSLAELKYAVRNALACSPWWVRDRGLPGPQCIRLTKISINQDGEVFWIRKRFQLAHPDSPPYRALSYTWGPAKGMPEDANPDLIHVDDGVERPVPKNLIRALKRIGELNENEWYWIDYISINQSLSRERSEQVSHMHNIYQQAIAVDVWLGDATEHEVTSTTRILREIAEKWREESRRWSRSPQGISPRRRVPVTYQEILPEKDWDVLTLFFSLRWFHRLWTLQEFSMAKQVRVLYGRGFIDVDTLGDAVSFLASHSMQMTIDYGNNDTAGIAVHQRFLMREYIGNTQQLIRFLPHFILDRSSIDYEAILALVFWHSAATLATDPRDYVYGITGVANAVMDQLMRDKDFMATHKYPTYQPFLSDYTLATAEVYKQFIVRLMGGSVGIRAITLAQKDMPGTKVRSRWRGYTLPSWIGQGNELPSWVPNLSDRQLLPLSAVCALGSCKDDVAFRFPNVFHHPHLTTKQKFRISGDYLHVFGKRIGTIAGESFQLPPVLDYELCVEFALNLIQVLKMLPEKHCSTNSTPIQGMLTSLGLGREEPEAIMNSKISFVPMPETVEELIAHGLSSLVCIQMGNSEYASVDTFLANDTFVSSAREIGGISPGFLMKEIENWRDPAKLFVWKHFVECIMQANALSNMANSCGALVTYFNKAKGQLVFAMTMDEMHHRRLCPQRRQNETPSRMFIGVGPNSMRANDEIWALRGSEWPFVLRRRPDLDKEQGVEAAEKKHKSKEYHPTSTGVDVYELIGEAYVDGIMDGELFGPDNIGDTLDEIAIR